MSGQYLRTGKDALGLWRWWLVDPRGKIVHIGPYAYESRGVAINAAHKSGRRFL